MKITDLEDVYMLMIAEGWIFFGKDKDGSSSWVWTDAGHKRREERGLLPKEPPKPTE